MTLKVIALRKRAAGVPLDDIHAALQERARQRPLAQGCGRYLQSRTLPQGYRKGELLFDGVEEWWFEEAQDARMQLALAAQERTGWSGLLDPLASCELVVRPHLAKEGTVPAGAVKNIEFVTRRPGMASAPFFRYWREVHGPLGATIPSILRYEQNHADEGFDGGPWRYDGLAITWFASTAEMRSGALTPEYQRTREDEANFLPDGHLPIIITREVVDTGWVEG